MKNTFRKIFSKENKPRPLFFLFLIVLFLGIFLRTYSFQNWLRFNADQSRDAEIVRNFLEGKSSLPLLGPWAGGTDFGLGPIFYYFQIVSAKIFGIFPDKMAYPDLFFSILSIPLLFILLKKYFNSRISLACTALFSISMFVVQYSRFAWNPNSTPFFVMLFLYGIFEASDREGRERFFWAAVAGIALGVSMQLHTVLLLVMPIATLIFLEYVYKTTSKTMAKEFAVIFLFALLLNVPQIFGELESGGRNARAFFSGTLKKTSNEMGIGTKVVENFLCQSQGNSYIISAIGPSADCGIAYISGELKRHKHLDKRMPIILESIWEIIFTLGGIILWTAAIKRETDAKRKKILVLLGIYFVTASVLLISLANEISTRFYLLMEFLPFLLLGFWIKNIFEWTEEKHKKTAVVFLSAAFVLLVGINVYKTGKMFAAFSLQGDIANDGVDNDSVSFITLNETRFIANYVVSHAGQQKKVYLEGRKAFIFKYLGSINYFTGEKDVVVKEYSEKETVPDDAIIFFIEDANNSGQLDRNIREKYVAEDLQVFGRFSITKLKKK